MAQTSYVQTLRAKFEAAQNSQSTDGTANSRKTILTRRSDVCETVDIGRCTLTALHLPAMARQQGLSNVCGPAIQTETKTNKSGIVQTRSQWPDSMKQEGNSNYDYDIVTHVILGREPCESVRRGQSEDRQRVQMDSALHYADASLIDREWEISEKLRSNSHSVSNCQLKPASAAVRSKSESDSQRQGSRTMAHDSKPQLPPKPIAKPARGIALKLQLKQSTDQPSTSCKPSEGLVTTATGGILRSPLPDADAPPKPHRKGSLVQTMKQWKSADTSNGQMANHIHRQSGTTDYILHPPAVNVKKDSSLKQSVLWKQNTRSGLWQEWLVKYGEECLQFYSTKDSVTTSPYAQVPLKAMESVHDINDQKTLNGTFQHCFAVETSQRSYQFSALSAGDQRSWVALLRSEIMRFKVRSAFFQDSTFENNSSNPCDMQLATSSNGHMPLPEPLPIVKQMPAALKDSDLSKSLDSEPHRDDYVVTEKCSSQSSVSSNTSVKLLTSLSNVVYEGCLWKQENNSQLWKYWKFILTTDFLRCYKSYKRVRNGDRPLATIPVSVITGVSSADISDNLVDSKVYVCPFEVITSQGRSYLLATSSSDERDLWVAALNRILIIRS